MELLIILIVLFIFVASVTLIGHGIWVILAWSMRVLLGKEDVEPQVTRLSEPPAGPLNDLAAFERQLVRFFREGKISDEI